MVVAAGTPITVQARGSVGFCKESIRRQFQVAFKRGFKFGSPPCSCETALPRATTPTLVEES